MKFGLFQTNGVLSQLDSVDIYIYILSMYAYIYTTYPDPRRCSWSAIVIALACLPVVPRQGQVKRFQTVSHPRGWAGAISLIAVFERLTPKNQDVVTFGSEAPGELWVGRLEPDKRLVFCHPLQHPTRPLVGPGMSEYSLYGWYGIRDRS